jgi:glutaminyl-peptide cyclotransferase
VYDAATLTAVDSVTYAGKGWGLTTDGNRLFPSDGTDQLRVIDPTTFASQYFIKYRSISQLLT